MRYQQAFLVTVALLCIGSLSFGQELRFAQEIEAPTTDEPIAQEVDLSDTINGILKLKNIQDTDTNIHTGRTRDKENVVTKPLDEIVTKLLSQESDKNKEQRRKDLAAFQRIEKLLPKEQQFSGKVIFWDAPNIKYNPLYFEEVGLERYSQDAGFLQPGLSGVHFFGRVLTLPIHGLVKRPFSCEYPLGYYRPLDCVPYLHYTFPW